MNNLPNEILIIILNNLLSTHTKIKFLSINKRFYDLTNNILFHDEINVADIINVSYFDRFTRIVIDKIPIRFPKMITHLRFNYFFNDRILPNTIPKSVYHIVFEWNFNQPIENIFHEGIKTIIFGFHFNQEINNNMPSTLKNLKFDFFFQKNIDDKIMNQLDKLFLFTSYKFQENLKKYDNKISYINKNNQWMYSM